MDRRLMEESQPIELQLRDGGVPLRCAPGRAARAVGHDTTVPNGAEPTGSPDTVLLCPGSPRSRPCGRASLTRRRGYRGQVTGDRLQVTAWTVSACRQPREIQPPPGVSGGA